MVENPIVKIGLRFKSSSYYLPLDNSINLVLKKEGLTGFTDEEIEEMAIESYNHEYNHFILNQYFNETVCKLYDTIEDKFRRNPNLIRKYFNNTHMMTWGDYIKKYGIQEFYYHYCINDKLLNEARIIAQKRVVEKGVKKL